MNSILLSFLCGAAFLGGATTVIVLLGMWTSIRENATGSVRDFWRRNLDQQAEILETQKRIANALERLGEK